MTNNHQFDKNLKRMLQSALDQPRPAFQQRLTKDVLAEVARQRQLETRRPWWRGLFSAQPAWRPLQFAAAAALALVAAGLWLLIGLPGRSIGQVRCLYGLVAIQNHGTPQTVSTPTDLKSGQWLETRVGSKAQVLFPDQSRLLPDPRTILQVASTRTGPRIRLEHGTISLEAAKQPPGKAITIESSRAHIKVLGTKLDVRAIEKPSGTRQTRVRVLSGSVELESAGQKLVLLPGTEGIADEGQPPVNASIVPQVNELLDLFHQAARPSGRPTALPALIDLTTQPVWFVVPTGSLTGTGPASYTLKLRYPAFQAKAYSLDGAEIPATGSGQILRLDLPPAMAARPAAYFILKVPGVGGLVKTVGDGQFECLYPGTDANPVALVRLYLPASTHLDRLLPPPLSTAVEHDNLIVTVAANVSLPPMY